MTIKVKMLPTQRTSETLQILSPKVPNKFNWDLFLKRLLRKMIDKRPAPTRQIGSMSIYPRSSNLSEKEAILKDLPENSLDSAIFDINLSNKSLVNYYILLARTDFKSTNAPSAEELAETKQKALAYIKKRVTINIKKMTSQIRMLWAVRESNPRVLSLIDFSKIGQVSDNQELSDYLARHLQLLPDEIYDNQTYILKHPDLLSTIMNYFLTMNEEDVTWSYNNGTTAWSYDKVIATLKKLVQTVIDAQEPITLTVPNTCFTSLTNDRTCQALADRFLTQTIGHQGNLDPKRNASLNKLVTYQHELNKVATKALFKPRRIDSFSKQELEQTDYEIVDTIQTKRDPFGTYYHLGNETRRVNFLDFTRILQNEVKGELASSHQYREILEQEVLNDLTEKDYQNTPKLAKDLFKKQYGIDNLKIANRRAQVRLVHSLDLIYPQHGDRYRPLNENDTSLSYNY